MTTKKGIRLPTKIRLMSSAEYDIVTSVFTDTIPYRIRILISDAAGASGRPFTIPTSLISTIVGITVAEFIEGVPAAMAAGVLGYLTSIVNVAYIINAGEAYDTLTTKDVDLLVHETTHVWQGKNSIFALSYVFNSVYNQCVLSNAYAYRLGDPWSSYNVEQQASIVEDWYTGGHLTSGRAYGYITDNVRKGDA